MKPAGIESSRRIGTQFPRRPLNYIDDIDIRPNLPLGCLDAGIEYDLTAVWRPGGTTCGHSSEIRQLDDVLAFGIAHPDFRRATAIGGESDVPSVWRILWTKLIARCGNQFYGRIVGMPRGVWVPRCSGRLFLLG